MSFCVSRGAKKDASLQKVIGEPMTFCKESTRFEIVYWSYNLNIRDCFFYKIKYPSG